MTWTKHTVALGLVAMMCGPKQEPATSAAPPDFSPTYGERFERTALYSIDPIAGGKRLQAGWLLFDDGEKYIVSYRPEPARYAFVDKRVVVVGRPYWPSALVQHVEGTHVEVESMVLAPGEVPWDPVPTAMPAPPFVRTAADLAARKGRWAQAVGRFVELEPAGDAGYGLVGSFELADATVVKISWAPLAAGLQELGTEPVTALVAVGADGEIAAYRGCLGEVARCGMAETEDP